MTSHRISLAAAVIATAVVLPLIPPAAAQGLPPQPNPITSPIPAPESATIHARITAINPQAATITLAAANGQKVTLAAGPAVNLSLLKVGDVVNAQYYRSVAFVLSTPGAPVPEDEIAQVIARQVKTPGGDALRLTRISAIVVGIDLAAHSIDVVEPSGGAVRTIAVTDPARVAALPQLKIGDGLTVVVSQALAVNITPAQPVVPGGFGENVTPQDPGGGR
jgi:hypothetical protein